VARLCRVRALNACARVRGRVRSWGNLERGGLRSRKAGTLERGGARSRECEPSSEADLARGGVLLGRSSGPRGPSRRGCAVCIRLALGSRCVRVLCFLQVLRRIPLVFQGTLRAVPDSSPRASVVYLSGSRRCWNLLIGHSSPWLQMPSAGPHQRTRGSSPRSPAGAWVLLQGFLSRNLVSGRGTCSNRHRQCLSRFR
jgi:hypothetical protein